MDSTVIVAIIGAIGLIANTIISKSKDKKQVAIEDLQESLEENKKLNEIIKASQLSIIRSQIVSKCETYMKKGYLPEYARYCLEELFKNYQALGGNHGIETIVEKCFELPLSKEEKENGEK